MKPFPSPATPALVGFIVAVGATLWVDEAPDHVRPYVIEHYANSHALVIGSQTYRFPITGPSSGGAFSLVSTNHPIQARLVFCLTFMKSIMRTSFATRAAFSCGQISSMNLTHDS